MPRRYTGTDLVLRCQQRCAMENDDSISSAEWATLVSEAYGELYNIVWEVGNEYFEFTQTLTTDGTNILSEIADHLSTVQLSWLMDGTTTGPRQDLRPAEAQERSRLSGNTGSPEYFALVDNKIYLYPTPQSGTKLELRYVPQPPEFSDLDTNVDVVTADGLTFLIYCVVVKALAKDQRDAQLAIMERDAARLRFTESAVLRSLNTGHHRVIDKGGGMLEGFGDGYSDSADWFRTR